jgi:type VI secretion system FHA domain protein
MALRLRVVSNQAKALGKSSTRVFGVHGGSIGRAGDNDWVLPDPDRYISGKHARVEYRAGSYWLTDTSSNGTYVNDATDPQSAIGPRELKDGDRLRMGDYDVVVNIDAANDFPPDKNAIVAYDGKASSIVGRQATDNDIGVLLNLDDLLAPGDSGSRAKPMNASGQTAESDGKAVARARAKVRRQIAADNAAANGAAETPWNLATRRIEPYRNPKRAAEEAVPAASEAPPQPQVQPQVPPQLQRVDTPPVDITAALQLLCHGAGIELSSIPVSAHPQMLQLAGQILREAMFGIMDVLQVRSELRHRFRIAQKTIQATDNNPLNFSAGVDEALCKLFEQRSNRYLGPVETVRESFRDLKYHHQAVVEALEVAFGEFMSRLEPNELQERFDRGLKRGGLLASSNKSKYWELYRELFQTLGQNAHGDLPHVFVEDFARAYEERIAELLVRAKGANGGRDERVPAAS